MGSSDILSLFFTKAVVILRFFKHLELTVRVQVFGPSRQTRVASGVLLSLSSAGSVMSTTFAAARGNFAPRMPPISAFVTD